MDFYPLRGYGNEPKYSKLCLQEPEAIGERSGEAGVYLTTV